MDLHENDSPLNVSAKRQSGTEHLQWCSVSGPGVHQGSDERLAIAQQVLSKC